MTSKPMTPAQMDADLSDMRAYLDCTALMVERCTHPTVEATSLWIFDKEGKQIAAVSRLTGTSKFNWEAQKMAHGLPITRIAFERMVEAAAYVVRHC